MKNTVKTILALMAAPALLFSCQKTVEPAPQPEDPQPSQTYTLALNMDSFSDRTCDAVGVYIPSVGTQQAAVDVKDDVRTLTFTTEKELTGPVSIFVPASATVDEDGIATFGIPSRQKASDREMPAVAAPVSVGDGSATLLSLCSYLDVNVSSTMAESAKLLSVTFTSESALAGNFEISLPVVDPSLSVTLAVSGLDGNSVTMEMESDVQLGTSPVAVRMLVAPGTYSGTVTVTTDKGSYEFSSISVNVARANAASVDVNIADPLVSLAVDTSVPYNILKTSDASIVASNTWLISKKDYVNNTNFAANFTDETIKSYFSLVEDENVVLLGGYVEKGKPDYGYTSIAVLVYDREDPGHPGCKEAEILSTNIAASLSWDGYTSNPGSAWYNPESGEIVIENCAGHLGWGYDFSWNRTYSPADDLTLATNSVSLREGAVKEVEITWSNGSCSAESDNVSVATVEVSESLIYVTGVSAGNATVTVTDQKGKTAQLAVTVTAAAATGGIPTDIKYDITLLEGDTAYSSSYKPTFADREIKGIWLCSRADYFAKTENSELFYSAKDPWVNSIYFNYRTDDDVIIAAAGYIGSDGTTNYAYLAMGIQLTSETVTEGEFAGCMVVNVLDSVISGSEAPAYDGHDLSWFHSAGYVSESGIAYFNPQDKTITIVNVGGKKENRSINFHRKLSPQE
ncbi:MAG: Ig-like domain-containing protein [Candidatus Cryptobacteroides sp.]